MGRHTDPFPWAEPYPASVYAEDKDGNLTSEETVFVRATAKQDIIANGKKFPAGDVVLPADFAHQHAAVLSAPISK